MESELQRLVERLGNRLGRSVAADDRNIHLLAYSPHSGDVDPVRKGSILQRRVAPEVVDYVYRAGAGDAEDLFTVPARPEIGFESPRIGVPVRHNGALLGFLWLLATDGAVSAEHALLVKQAAETAAVIIHREYLIGELTRGRERELTRDLLADQADVRARAAEDLVADNLCADGPVHAIVVALGKTGPSLTEQERLALASGVEHGRQRSPQHYALALERPDHAVLLLVEDNPRSRKPVIELSESIRDHVGNQLASATSCWVGISEVKSSLSEAYSAYLDARRAADVASVVRVLGSVVRYGQLGVYGMLAELPAERLADSLHPGLRALFGQGPTAAALVQTVEVLLDNAGDIKRTAEQLHIHRTSLYNRLKRVEEITKLDLSNGDDRLTLHLGLKIANLMSLR